MVISLADFIELRSIAQQKGEAIFRKTTFETEDGLPRTLGKGSERSINLRSGLTLKIMNGKLRETIRVDRQHQLDFPLVAKFYLSGVSRIQTKEPVLTNIKANYSEVAGCHYLYHLPNIVEIEEWPSNELHQVVIISAQASYLRSFSLDDTPLVPPLRQFLDGDQTQRFYKSLGQLSPSMKQVLQQIVQSPYQGMMQHLYLESKTLELLALQFSHWAEVQPSRRSRPMVRDELERLYTAKAILIRNIGKPPTLAHLAQQVELSEYKLKQGFRKVFGTTIFGYLHHYRMQQAQQLLLNSNLTIAGVAERIGYRNPEAFSTAFRRKFAISPKAYQLGK